MSLEANGTDTVERKSKVFCIQSGLVKTRFYLDNKIFMQEFKEVEIYNKIYLIVFV